MNLVFKTSRGKSKLNPNLVAQQNLDQGDVNKIILLHKQKDRYLDEIEKTGDRDILTQIENTEYQLQDAWKFPRNRSWHVGWLEPKNCLCPKLDNLDNIGAGDDDGGFRYHNANCPLHGQILTNPENNE